MLACHPVPESTPMCIALGSHHAGFRLKERVKTLRLPRLLRPAAEARIRKIDDPGYGP